MKINNYLERYLIDKTYTITIKENMVHIINYIEVTDFTNERIIIKHNKGNTTITGNNLIISKMVSDELLIEGKIKNVEV